MVRKRQTSSEKAEVEARRWMRFLKHQATWLVAFIGLVLGANWCHTDTAVARVETRLSACEEGLETCNQFIRDLVTEKLESAEADDTTPTATR